jgi:hypothetical protein
MFLTGLAVAPENVKIPKESYPKEGSLMISDTDKR